MSQMVKLQDRPEHERREIQASIVALSRMGRSSVQGYEALVRAAAHVIAHHAIDGGDASLEDLMDNFDEIVVEQHDLIRAYHQRVRGGLN